MSPFDEPNGIEKLKEMIKEHKNEYIELYAPQQTEYPVAEFSMEVSKLRQKISELREKVEELIKKKQITEQYVIDNSYDTCMNFNNRQTSEVNQILRVLISDINKMLSRSLWERLSGYPPLDEKKYRLGEFIYG